MIRFNNWTIQADGEIIARQFDNLTRTLTVAGDIPAGWDWDMLVQVGDGGCCFRNNVLLHSAS